MPNHYHLVVESPLGNLSRAMAWLQTTYTVRFNLRHRRIGHLFQGRYKAHLIEADEYSKEILRYIHLNPVRPRDKRAEIPKERRALLGKFTWSSHRFYLGKSGAASWMSTDWLSFFGRRRRSAVQEYNRFIDDAFGRKVESPWDGLRGGLVLGSESFYQWIRQRMANKEGGGEEEVRWLVRTEDDGVRRESARRLAEEQPERAWGVWARVHLGGERRIDVARAFGYKDGSAITQMLKRLERRILRERPARRRARELRAAHEHAVSSVKR